MGMRAMSLRPHDGILGDSVLLSSLYEPALTSDPEEFEKSIPGSCLVVAADAAREEDPGLGIKTILTDPSSRGRLGEAPGRGLARALVWIQKRPGSNVFANMVTLGRAANNDILINDARASKVHLLLAPAHGPWEWAVTEMGSSNGTHLNGAPLCVGEKRVLTPGDRLEIAGAIVLEFLDPPALAQLLRAEAIR
ncbi:FHA domain-containing protein [Planctomycetota bacterium]|nr:FHA domain-containing protein [Planctomycetota bacterium]